RPENLDSFLHNSGEHVRLSVPLIRKLSPDSLSVMEFRCELDVRIAEKMIRFPLLGEEDSDSWKFKLTREFDMTNDSKLFRPAPGSNRLPLYEGKMVWHFDHKFAEPRYWVEEKEARKSVLSRTPDIGQKLDYQGYRLGLRSVASNTNERTLIASVIPRNVFCGNSLLTTMGPAQDAPSLVFLAGVFDSFVLDAMLRSKATINVNMFFIYQLPVPRLTAADAAFAPIVKRAAQLICTTPEFDALAKEVSTALKLPAAAVKGVTDPAARAQLRAELDGLIAHLYALTESEFAHILTTFPLVAQDVKDATMESFRKTPEL
ncbi:MAG: ATP-binding protein, partial [Verrucomicrobiota bacterium]